MDNSLSPTSPAVSRRSRWTHFAIRAFVRVGLPLLIVAGLWTGFIKWQTDHLLWAMATCRQNLVKIDMAKAQFEVDHHLKPGDPVTWADLYSADGRGYLRELPKEPLGGSYVINPSGTNPECSKGFPGHNIEGECVTTRVD